MLAPLLHIPARITPANHRPTRYPPTQWNAWTPPELAGRLPFRPMARTAAQLTGPEWQWIAGAGAAMVHFLNEPERQQPAVTPARAAALWREHMLAQLRGGGGRTKLVGPAVASDAAGRAWLRAFLALLRRADGEWPDYLGAHYYGEEAGEARRYLEGLRAEFGLEVVVSEIGCVAREAARVERFTVAMANWMDETPWVVEYGFFGCMAEVADDVSVLRAQSCPTFGGGWGVLLTNTVVCESGGAVDGPQRCLHAAYEAADDGAADEVGMMFVCMLLNQVRGLGRELGMNQGGRRQIQGAES